MPQTAAIATFTHDSRHKKASVKTKNRLRRLLFASFCLNGTLSVHGVRAAYAAHARRAREKDGKKMGRFTAFVW